MVLMSTFILEVVVERPVTSGSEIQSWKQFEPSSLLAQEYAAALMKVTLWGFLGSTGGTDFRISRTGSRSFGRFADDRSVLTEGELLELCCDGCRKKMLPNVKTGQIVIQCSERSTLSCNKITTRTNSNYVKVIMSLMKDKSGMKYSLQCSERSTEAESETTS